ncbi:hypothetical protein HN51_030536 [Arachis hypogaea]
MTASLVVVAIIANGDYKLTLQSNDSKSSARMLGSTVKSRSFFINQMGISTKIFSKDKDCNRQRTSMVTAAT